MKKLGCLAIAVLIALCLPASSYSLSPVARPCVLAGGVAFITIYTNRSDKELVVTAAGLRPGPDLTDAVAATKAALRRVAHRYLLLSQEIAELDQALTVVVAKTTPRLVALMGVGTDVAGQLQSPRGTTRTGW